VYGAGFGFALGCTSMFASALLTAGVGPWLPFQMLCSAWIGMGAGLLPKGVRGRREIAMLAGYGVVVAYLFGFLMNLWFWPFITAAEVSYYDGTISYVPGDAVLANLHRFAVFTVLTSTVGWDTGRAITNAIAIVVVGPALLATFRRASRKASYGIRPLSHPGRRAVRGRPLTSSAEKPVRQATEFVSYKTNSVFGRGVGGTRSVVVGVGVGEGRGADAAAEPVGGGRAVDVERADEGLGQVAREPQLLDLSDQVGDKDGVVGDLVPPAGPRYSAASPQWNSHRSRCHPAKPGVRPTIASTTSAGTPGGTSAGSTIVNRAPKRSEAVPSAMHHGQRRSAQVPLRVRGEGVQPTPIAVAAEAPAVAGLDHARRHRVRVVRERGEGLGHGGLR
jgi:hypothetical protein